MEASLRDIGDLISRVRTRWRRLIVLTATVVAALTAAVVLLAGLAVAQWTGRSATALAVTGVVAVVLALAAIARALWPARRVPTDARVVVTAAEPERRRVLELDGQPATRRYAELVQAQGASHLDAVMASSFPFALYVGGRPYVRSVADIDGDTLQFASAVDPGAVLRLMRAGDLVGSTRQALTTAADAVGGELQAVIAFSCLGRHREAITGGMRAELAAIYDSNPLIGFHSFGEQAGPLLVNHTLTGLALGGARG